MAGVKLAVVSTAPRRSLEVRLWGRAIAGPNGCVLWTGSVNRHGYGKIKQNGTHRATHSPSGINSRRSECPQGHPYDDGNTRIKASKARVCRTCERDRHERRVAAPERPPVHETCRQGHPLTEDNIVRQGAVLTCRISRRASQARYRARKRAQRAGVSR